jgi:hypothetical protein
MANPPLVVDSRGCGDDDPGCAKAVAALGTARLATAGICPGTVRLFCSTVAVDQGRLELRIYEDGLEPKPNIARVEVRQRIVLLDAVRD